MKTLVLDKSVPRGANEDRMRALSKRFDFLPPEVLLYEIVTEDFRKREELSRQERKRLDDMIDATFGKSIRCAGNVWIRMQPSIRWEIEKGRSAKFGPRFSIEDIRVSNIITPEKIKQTVEYEDLHEKLVGMTHLPEDEDDFQLVRGMSEREVLETMQGDFASEKATRDIAEMARKGFTKVAEKQGYKVSPFYKPNREWLSFGVYLAHQGWVPWKYHKYGDESPQPKKPANPSFDLTCIGHMAIADGILSSDKEQLKLAWALWPEKRESVYYYDQATHKAEVFEPEWEL